MRVPVPPGAPNRSSFAQTDADVCALTNDVESQLTSPGLVQVAVIVHHVSNSVPVDIRDHVPGPKASNVAAPSAEVIS